MDQTLHQLAGLLIGSIPTIVLFLLVVVLYRFLVYGALVRTLDLRRERTQGAIERAHAAIAAADAKAQEYEAKLRAARAEIFAARQHRLQVWNRERESAIADAQQAAQRRVGEGKAALQAEASSARVSLEGSAEELANRVLQAILPADLAPLGSAR